MTHLEIALSLAGTKDPIIGDVQGAFVFVVGGERFNCSRIVAQFLSQRICNSHRIDPSITEYVIDTLDLKEEFKLFLSLSEGSTVRVDEGMARSFVALCGELDNSGLCIPLLKHFQSDIGLAHICTFGDESLLDSVASQFTKFSRSDLDNIPLPALYHILSLDSLVIEGEDWLYEYISSRFSTDAEFSEWIQFVQFKYLSDKCIENFTLRIPEYIDRRLWKPLSRRLMIGCRGGTPFPVTRVRPFRPRWRPGKKPTSRLSPGGGIIAYLTRLHDQNVHDKGIVTVTSKSLDESNLPGVVNFFSSGEVCTKGEPDSWICWDFHNLVALPTHYYAQSRSLYSWVVESSLDGENWVEIDRRTEQDAWDTEFEASNSNECRFIRLTQITGRQSRRESEVNKIRSSVPPDFLWEESILDETPRRDSPLMLKSFDVFGRLRECYEYVPRGFGFEGILWITAFTRTKVKIRVTLKSTLTQYLYFAMRIICLIPPRQDQIRMRD
jgi:hypothetical protein